MRLGPRDAVHQHAAAVDQPLGAGPGSNLLAGGQEPVEPDAGRVRADGRLGHQASFSDAGSARPGWCSSRATPISSSTTPVTMKLSARLNVGQWLRWMKSVT